MFHPASEIYGSAPAGQAREQQFTLVNSGLTFAGRLTFTITGPGASGFTLSRNRCAGVSLPPGGSCSGVIRFLPDQAALYRAGLTARGRSLFGLGKITARLPLSGTGTAAVSHLVFTPATHDYGKVPAGESATETFTLSNDGTAAADAATITMTGDTAAFLTTADTCNGQDLAPGQHCTLTIEFQPAAATGYTAQVDAAAAADHATLPLTGTGTAAQAQSILAGGNHNCAVKTDHTLWCWGNNFSGQLGDGTHDRQPGPGPGQRAHRRLGHRHRRRGRHVRGQDRSHPVVLGTQRLRPARRRHHDQQPGPGPGQRARHRLGHRHRRPGLHVRGKDRRHRVVLGSQQLRPARGRHYH